MPARSFLFPGVAVVASLALMAALDFVTGQELAFSCAYLIPVCLTAWHFSRRTTVAVALLSGVTAYFVDLFDGEAYLRPGIEYWNAFTCFIISLSTGLLLFKLKEALTKGRKTNDELRAALENLAESTAEIRKLQNGLQVVCAWTKRIKVDDEWMAPDEFLRKHLHLQITHGISPEAFAAAEKELEEEELRERGSA